MWYSTDAAAGGNSLIADRVRDDSWVRKVVAVVVVVRERQKRVRDWLRSSAFPLSVCCNKEG